MRSRVHLIPAGTDSPAWNGLFLFQVSLTSSAVFMNLLDGDDGNEKRIEALKAAVAEVR